MCSTILVSFTFATTLHQGSNTAIPQKFKAWDPKKNGRWPQTFQRQATVKTSHYQSNTTIYSQKMLHVSD